MFPEWKLTPELYPCAGKSFKIPVFQGTLDKDGFSWPGSFDAITMSHVIEHVYDPLDLLKECHRILARGGCLRVPLRRIYKGWGIRFFKKDWLALDHSPPSLPLGGRKH